MMKINIYKSITLYKILIISLLVSYTQVLASSEITPPELVEGSLSVDKKEARPGD